MTVSFSERSREWIHKPVIHAGPLSYIREYVQSQLEQFREEHKQFDAFLIEVGASIKAEDNHDLENIERFIDGGAETSWIYERRSMFDALIKLFNLCLSPRQAFEYIKECLALYKEMLNADYQLRGSPCLSIRRRLWASKEDRFVSFRVEPETETEGRDCRYSFAITIPPATGNVSGNDITRQVEFRCDDDRFEDALMLFEFHQNRGLLRKVYDSAIRGLEQYDAIKDMKAQGFWGWCP